jgi:hypothetical protein
MRRPLLFMSLWSLAALLLTYMGGVRHDYGDYLKQWRLVLAGENPWGTNNAYGPLHNAFAYLLQFDELAPKMLTAFCFAIAGALLFRALLARRPLREWGNIFVLVIAANILVIVSVFWFGLNDGFVAALIIAAVLSRFDDRLLLAGVFLGLATLDKYYPALLIPFFALNDGRIAPRLLLGSLLTIAIGIAAAIWIWGSAYLEAIFYGVSRDATILSIFRPIAVIARSYGDPGGIADWLVRLNGSLVILVWIGSFVIAWRRRDNWLSAATWSFFAVLLTYKVGNPQFWVSWLALVAALPLVGRPDADRLARLSLPFATFLTLFEIGYVLLQPQYYLGRWTIITDYVGVLSFALGGWMLWQYLRKGATA